MLVPPRLNAHPALLSALLPLLVGGGAVGALPSLVGGGERACHMAGAAGPYSALMAVAVLGVMGVLCALQRPSPSVRSAPLVVLVGLATLPWLLGIAGTQQALERVLRVLPSDVGSGESLALLVPASGEAMVTRMLGAWMSAALLLAVALGRVLPERRRGWEQAGRWLGAALALTLGALAFMVALEAWHLFELLTSVASQSPEARVPLITTGTAWLAGMQELRSATLGVLAVLALALVGWQFFLKPEAVSQWVGSLVLAALVATVLFLDTWPLRLPVNGTWEVAAGPGRTLRIKDVLASALSAVPYVPGLDPRR